MSNPKVSVIIPVYNVEKYLRECLDSVINQTFSDIEIICVNDGSTDSSLEILQEYAQKDNRIKIVNKENGGLSSARNEGLKHIKGEYCYFLDSDDYILPDLFNYAVKIFKRENVDYLCFGSEAFLDKGNVFQNFEDTKRYLSINYTGVCDVDLELGKNTNIHVWNKIYKTEKIKKYDIKFINGLLYEDIYFVWYYMFLSKKVYYTSYKFHKYRLRENSIMEETLRAKSFDLTVSHLLNWYELFKSVSKNKELFVEKFDDLKSLLEMYVEITLDKTKEDEHYLIYEKKMQYQKELKIAFKKLCSLKDKLEYNLRKLFDVEEIKNTSRIRIKLLGLNIKYKKQKKFNINFNKKSGNDFSSVFNKTNNKNEKLLEELKSCGRFKFLPNRGNLGDIAIGTACYQYFDSNNLEYDVIDMATKKGRKFNKPFNLVYGGGGLFISYYREYYQDILEIFRSKHLKKAVICPASFHDCLDVLECLDERFVVFCREQKSYDYCVANNKRAKFYLADDMVFGLNIDFYKFFVEKELLSVSIPNSKEINKLNTTLYPYYKDFVERVDIVTSIDSNIGYFLRTDSEKNIDDNIVPSYVDLSLMANSFCADKSCCVLLFTQFFRALDSFEIIVTDRLHIAICSMLLGKTVYMIDNSYKKLSKVYEKSMSDKKNVNLIPFDKLDAILNLVPQASGKELHFTEVQFEKFVKNWVSVRNNFGAEKAFWRE